MFERFTEPARAVVMRAQQEARQLHQLYVGTEHLLLALLSAEAGIARTVLTEAGLTAGQVRAEVERLVGPPSKFFTDEEASALQDIGIDVDEVLNRIEESFGPEALQPPTPPRRGLGRRGSGRRTKFTTRAKKVLELSLREAIHLHHDHIGTEHILLGLLREGDGLAAKVITDAGLRPDDLRRATIQALDQAA